MFPFFSLNSTEMPSQKKVRLMKGPPNNRDFCYRESPLQRDSAVIHKFIISGNI